MYGDSHSPPVNRHNHPTPPATLSRPSRRFNLNKYISPSWGQQTTGGGLYLEEMDAASYNALNFFLVNLGKSVSQSVLPHVFKFIKRSLNLTHTHTKKKEAPHKIQIHQLLFLGCGGGKTTRGLPIWHADKYSNTPCSMPLQIGPMTFGEKGIEITNILFLDKIHEIFELWVPNLTKRSTY